MTISDKEQAVLNSPETIARLKSGIEEAHAEAPVRLSVDQMIEAFQAEEIELSTRINARLGEIHNLEQANTQDRARRRVVKRVLTATKPRDRKAPAKKVAAKSG